MDVSSYVTVPDCNPEQLLNKVILVMRSTRPKVDTSLPFTVFIAERMLQLWINSPACRFSLSGKCSICDYWDGVASDNSVLAACKYIEYHGNGYETLLLNTCGSCLCDAELSFTNLIQIMRVIAQTKIKHVILESHLAYTDIGKLQDIMDVLGNKRLMLEYGQESTSAYVLKYCLNKPSMLTNYSIAKMLQNIGIYVIANVVLGAPFLTVRQRVQDAVDSIRELLLAGIDSVVLFPVNIKPYTLVMHLFDNGYYKRVNAAEIVMVLLNFNADELARIDLAWFEPQREKQEAYEATGYSPQYCTKCGQVLLKHLFDYRMATDGGHREIIIRQAERDLCECVNTLYEYQFPDIQAAYKFLENSITGTEHATD
jgi:radical SAM enzyme (TIGR01210 family)